MSKKIAEAIYFHALETSCELAQERGKHPSFNDTRAANVYTISWDGTNNHGERAASGVYFYRLVAGKFHETRKMVLVR